MGSCEALYWSTRSHMLYKLTRAILWPRSCFHLFALFFGKGQFRYALKSFSKKTQLNTGVEVTHLAIWRKLCNHSASLVLEVWKWTWHCNLVHAHSSMREEKYCAGLTDSHNKYTTKHNPPTIPHALCWREKQCRWFQMSSLQYACARATRAKR